MTDVQSAVEKALYDRIRAQVPDVPGFQHVPDDTAPPVWFIGDVTFENEGEKAGALLRFDVSLVAFIAGPSRKPMNLLQSRIFDALNDWRPTDTAEVIFGPVQVISSSSQEIQGTQSPIYFGQQTAIIYAQAV